MLYIIGCGLNDYRDISLRSMEILKKADRIYHECYTCISAGDMDTLETLVGKELIPANRKLVEEGMEIVDQAATQDVVFMVSGTPLFATTHTDLIIRAKEKGIPVQIIHNISILNSKGCFGLYSYNFGRTISIPYFTETCKYVSCYDNIHKNWTAGMHTLCLLDIKTDENRFMTANEAIEQLLECESIREYGMFTRDTKLFALCRFATDSELVKYGTASELLETSFGPPLHSLIIPGAMDEIEKEMVEKLFM